MNHNKYSYFIISGLLILILMLSLSIISFRDKQKRQDVVNELEYVKIKQSQTEGYLLENMELYKMIGLNLRQEYVRNLDNVIFELGGIDRAFPKIYIYFSANQCKSCVDYVMGKLLQVNDLLGVSNVTLFFHNFEDRQVYVNKVKMGLNNDIYMLGDMSAVVDLLDSLSKPVLLLTDDHGTVISAYSPSEDFDYLFDAYLDVLKTNPTFKGCLLNSTHTEKDGDE